VDLFGLRRRAVESLQQSMAAEGVLLLEVNVRGTITHRNFRGPGRRITLDKRVARWTVALTGRRILVRWGERPYVDVEWSDTAHQQALAISVDGPSLLIQFDAGAFSDDSSGIIEIRAHVADPAEALRIVRARR